MKLLLDQGLPRSTVEQLCKAGIEASHVGELGLATAGDEEIEFSPGQVALCGCTVKNGCATKEKE